MYIRVHPAYHGGMANFYEILGVAQDATAETIRRAILDAAVELLDEAREAMAWE